MNLTKLIELIEETLKEVPKDVDKNSVRIYCSNGMLGSCEISTAIYDEDEEVIRLH